MGLTRIGANATVGQPIPPPLQSHPGTKRMRACVRYALVLCAGVPTLLSAQGFGIYEQGTCAMGRAGTGVAAPCSDGSAMFFNPAGLAGLTGAHATIGVTLIDIQGGFTDDVFQQHTELDDPLIGVPQLYISYGATSKLAVGVGLFAPYGLETRWPMTFDGRFAGYKNFLRSVYIQPTLAYQLTPRLSVGGGLDIVLGKVELNQHLDLADAPVPLPGLPLGTTFSQFGIAPGTDFVNAHLEATKTTVAAHFGATFKATDRLSFGANFLTQAKFDYSGTATFTQVPTNLVVPADLPLDLPLGTLTIPAGCHVDDLLTAPTAACGGLGLGLFNTGVVTQPVATTVKNPSQLALGVAYKVTNAWTLLGDYQLTWGSQFNELGITFPQDATGFLNRKLFEKYQNTSGFRFGAEWAKDARWTLRGGYLHHDGAAPAETVTPLLPEGQRNEFTAGAAGETAEALTAGGPCSVLPPRDPRGPAPRPIFHHRATTPV